MAQCDERWKINGRWRSNERQWQQSARSDKRQRRQRMRGLGSFGRTAAAAAPAEERRALVMRPSSSTTSATAVAIIVGLHLQSHVVSTGRRIFNDVDILERTTVWERRRWRRMSGTHLRSDVNSCPASAAACPRGEPGYKLPLTPWNDHGR